MVNDEKSLQYTVDTINDDNAYAYYVYVCMYMFILSNFKLMSILCCSE